jgi:hypothetical protein
MNYGLDQKFVDALHAIAPDLDEIRNPQSEVYRYDAITEAIIWNDELPVRCSVEKIQSLRPVFRYRASITLGQPDVEWERYWQLAKSLFPHWVGFSSERVAPGPEVTSYLRRQVDDTRRQVRTALSNLRAGHLWTTDANKHVLIFVGEDVQIAFVDKAPPTIVWRGEPFHAIRYQDMHGHHDWLRNSHEEIIGVRHWLLGVPPAVVERVRESRCSEVWSSGDVIEIFLTDSKKYVDDSSQDHVIAEDDIYLSKRQGAILAYRTPDTGAFARPGRRLISDNEFELKP